MKLIDLTCSKCNAALQVNPELTKCICNYCGNEMLIDDEVKKSEIQNGFELGYQMELGRIKAQEDIAKKQKQEELENKKKEEERQRQIDEEKKFKEQIAKQREYASQHQKEEQVQKLKKENKKALKVILVLIAIYLLLNISKCGTDSNKPNESSITTQETTAKENIQEPIEDVEEIEKIEEENNEEMTKEEIEAYTKGQQMGADAANYLNDLMSK